MSKVSQVVLLASSDGPQQVIMYLLYEAAAPLLQCIVPPSVELNTASFELTQKPAHVYLTNSTGIPQDYGSAGVK